MSLPPHYRRSFYLLAATIIALGCRKAEQIQSYTVPKEPPRTQITKTGEPPSAGGNGPAQAADATTPTDRMLAAVLPDGQRAWFFKVVGPIAAIEKHADQIAEFFTSIRPAAGQSLPTWNFPAGWTLGPGNPMRAATIVIPSEKPLELTVTMLGWSGSQDDLLRNINRWRGQMHLPDIGPQQLASTTSEVKVGDATMTVVDLQGRFQTGGMMVPFAGGGASSPPSAPSQAGGLPRRNTNTELPAGHPPIGPASNAAAPQADVAPSTVPTFDVPSTWKTVALQPGSMRKASFLITDGAKQANVGLIDFSTKEGPMIADPLANVNRWRQEVGLPVIKTDDLDSATESIEVGGQKSTFSAMIPDASQPGQAQNDRATLAAIVPQGDRVWFIKLTGDRDVVAAEQERFKDFLKSVRFGAGRGAIDGN